jgi:DNA processing protein
MTATLDWVSLRLVPGLGLSGFWRLIEHFQTPTEILRATGKELRQVRGLQERQISGLCSSTDLRERGRNELERLTAIGGLALSFQDQGYPPLLRQLIDPPPVIYVLGEKDFLCRPAVAIVGSRAATTYGRRTAFNLARNLAALPVTVISGLALGIDTESHKGALTGKGSTVGVLGCGLDVIYPRQNQSLYRQIAEGGALVTEYPLGTRPEGFRFPARNRIIAGLSKGVVVVEAAKRSGSLITAQIALDSGREVFAVPGQVDSFKSEGAHWLLQQGAKLVQRIEDIVVELNFDFSSSEEDNSSKGDSNFDIDPDALALLGCIEPYPQMRQSLSEQSGLSPARLSELLLFLELEGLIEMLPGDKLRKISR